MYHVAVNGPAIGPYDLNELSQMIALGTLIKDSLVWKQGMQNWEKASSIEELDNLFINVMPVIPNENE